MRDPRITGFVDFVYRPEFYMTRKLDVSETVSVFMWEEGDTLLGALERA
jgi:hypothetical protein